MVLWGALLLLTDVVLRQSTVGTVTLPPGADRVSVRTVNGDVVLQPAGSDATRASWVTDHFLLAPDPSVVTDRGVDVRANCPMDNVLGLGHCAVDFDIRVEPGTPTDLESVNGDVRVTALRAPLTMSTGNGQVSATALNAPRVRAESDNGSVHLEFTGVPDLVEATSVTADVVVRIPAGAYDVAVDADSTAIGVRHDPASPHRLELRGERVTVEALPR